ncbi:MAG: metallopeptidase family protein [Candidatus Geothermincolia bacterium]
MDLSEFEDLVERVIESIPEDFAEALEDGNVGVMVQDRPGQDELEALGISGRGTLLGLYHGIPPAQRGLGYSLVLPDNITIYREPVEQYASQTGRQVDDMVREVVLHEIAHHFGIPDSRLRELGY